MPEEKAGNPSALPTQSAQSDLPATEVPAIEVPVIDVRDLLAHSREAVLLHAGERYRLRITAKDKLILTK